MRLNVSFPRRVHAGTNSKLHMAMLITDKWLTWDVDRGVAVFGALLKAVMLAIPRRFVLMKKSCTSLQKTVDLNGTIAFVSLVQDFVMISRFAFTP